MIIHLKYCSVEWTNWGCMTRFEDGSEIGAHPHWQDHCYHVVAHRCGYEFDLLAYCREHEVAHSLVEQVFFDRPSRALWALAHGKMLPGREVAYEEMMAQALQRFLRAAERPIVGGVDWDWLRGEAERVLGKLDGIAA